MLLSFGIPPHFQHRVIQQAPEGVCETWGSPALHRKTQCDGVGPVSAASGSDTAACLLSPGELENIAEGGERWLFMSGRERMVPGLCGSPKGWETFSSDLSTMNMKKK